MTNFLPERTTQVQRTCLYVLRASQRTYGISAAAQEKTYATVSPADLTCGNLNCHSHALYSYSMRVRIIPQYRARRKLTPREVADAQLMVGMLGFRIEKGRTVMRLWQVVGDVRGPTAEVWMPLLAAMFSDTFRLTGIEKASGGA